MIAFSRANQFFKEKNANLLGLSVDSNASHLAWIFDIFNRTGVRISFPIIADRSGNIARKYGMISNDVSNTATVRNVYIIDGNGIVRAILIYPMEVGRFIPEILRLLDALQIADKNKMMTSANWMPGNPLIVPMPQVIDDVEKREAEVQKKGNGISWYLSFNQPNERLNVNNEK